MAIVLLVIASEGKAISHPHEYSFPWKRFYLILTLLSEHLWHLPLIKKQVNPDTTTVLGVWLGSQVARWDRLDYHRIEGLYASGIRKSEISDAEKIPILITSFTAGIEPNELVARGDYNSQRLLLLTPHFPDIPSYQIHIPLKRRKSLFNEGAEEARRLMETFRRPIQIPRAQMPSFDSIRGYFQSLRSIGSYANMLPKIGIVLSRDKIDK